MNGTSTSLAIAYPFCCGLHFLAKESLMGVEPQLNTCFNFKQLKSKA